MSASDNNNDAKIITQNKKIEFSDPVGDEIGYMSWANVQANLPHSRPYLHSASDRRNSPELKNVEKDLWRRRNGGFILTIQSFKQELEDGEIKNYGLPWGAKPRLIMAWLTREAVTKGDRILHLGNSFGDFLKALGFRSRSGGESGTDISTREQMTRLFSSRITLTTNQESALDEHYFGLRNCNIVDSLDFWWNEKTPDNFSLWESEIELSEKFFLSIVKSPVPLDLRILQHPEIRQSPMAIDIYCWLTYKMYKVRRPQPIRWPTLEQQFGSDYGRSDHFQNKFKNQLAKVVKLYSGARITILKDQSGILLKQGRPSVKSVVYKSDA
jgi:hypothetical protein